MFVVKVSNWEQIVGVFDFYILAGNYVIYSISYTTPVTVTSLTY